MESRVLVLGAGFAGLELATTLSEVLGDEAGVTLIDANDSFVFGYSKLDVMFGREPAEAVRLHYSEIDKPGVRFARERITAIDPETRTVETDAGTHTAEHLVIALGADYDAAATPGIELGRNEFYSVPGAEHLAGVVPSFAEGNAVIGVCGAPYKCPPAPSEACLLLHDQLVGSGTREQLLDHLREPARHAGASLPRHLGGAARGVRRSRHRVPRRIAGSPRSPTARSPSTTAREIPCDLFLGVPKHRAPDVVVASGMTEDGYIPVDSRTLATGHPNVWACGDVATIGVPKAGVFAEGAARVVASAIIASVRSGSADDLYEGRGSCYIEFGDGRVGRVDVDFLGGPQPTGVFQPPSDALVAEKVEFGSSRRARWF